MVWRRHDGGFDRGEDPLAALRIGETRRRRRSAAPGPPRSCAPPVPVGEVGVPPERPRELAGQIAPAPEMRAEIRHAPAQPAASQAPQPDVQIGPLAHQPAVPLAVAAEGKRRVAGGQAAVGQLLLAHLEFRHHGHDRRLPPPGLAPSARATGQLCPPAPTRSLARILPFTSHPSAIRSRLRTGSPSAVAAGVVLQQVVVELAPPDAVAHRRAVVGDASPCRT